MHELTAQRLMTASKAALEQEKQVKFASDLEHGPKTRRGPEAQAQGAGAVPRLGSKRREESYTFAEYTTSEDKQVRLLFQPLGLITAPFRSIYATFFYWIFVIFSSSYN